MYRCTIKVAIECFSYKCTFSVYKCTHFYLFCILAKLTETEALLINLVRVTIHLYSLAFSLRSFSVAMFYRNDSSVAEPYSLTLPGCAQPCPLQDFIGLTQSVIPTDWQKDCQISSSANDKGINKDKFLTHTRTLFSIQLVTAIL